MYKKSELIAQASEGWKLASPAHAAALSLGGKERDLKDLPKESEKGKKNVVGTGEMEKYK